MMTNEEFFGRLFAGGNFYWLTRFIILRLLGVVYAVAFLVAAQQLVPLIGEHGLTPATRFLIDISLPAHGRASVSKVAAPASCHLAFSLARFSHHDWSRPHQAAWRPVL